ncbi:hypothetical protein [Halopseudomonas bauzanensis]|uniref:Uncharacterized protein n=1 Tax=Halopseudomonas bauzanensis TaxID=653930 RepID=A0A1I4LSI6_9GAMM|nr:hypothetical protein [Halopseudomonas bauzanensis]TKA92859.1 hypothetical protein FA869_01325 [Halopseudomonas bauzanensis]SER86728.1 hypothetical protein SAMN05216589_1622 [Halopseudomonas bauzanensis]SFL94048.1 hypothetical protein SAMN04487855_1691 [Halopseudomonas bauzanensis]
MLLKLLDTDDVVIGEPLPWDLLDADGKVLFRRTQRIDSGPLLNNGDEVYLNAAGVEYAQLGEADRLYLSNMVYQNMLKEHP